MGIQGLSKLVIYAIIRLTMDILQSLFDTISLLRESPEILAFIEKDLLYLIFVGLAFGFAVLLVEIRLPLKYYWSLPSFLLRHLLADFNLLKRSPVWGYCLDSKTDQIIPLTAIELLDADSKEVIQTTYSNRLGQYGFRVKPGKFIVRAIKNHYIAPPFYDPENIRLRQTDESLALPVAVNNGEWPTLNLVLQPVSMFTDSEPIKQFTFFFRAFTINLANGFLALSVLGGWYGWIITNSWLFAVLLAVGIVFMFIKIYILEAVGAASKETHV